MLQILVTYYSKSGNTEKVAQVLANELTHLIKEKGIPDLGVVVKKVMDVSVIEVVDACGVAIGTPDYFSYMAGQVKILFDELWERREDVVAKPVMGFVSHGGGGKAMKSLAEMAKPFKWKALLGKWGFALGIEEAPDAKSTETIRSVAQMFLSEVIKSGA
jgi:flavorubredoxin